MLRFHSKSYLRTQLLATVALSASGLCFAQESTGPSRGPRSWELSLGQAGLLYEQGSYDNFGAVQQRLGNSRAQIEATRQPGIPERVFKDDTTCVILPADLTLALPGSSKNYLRLNGLMMNSHSEPNPTWLDIRTRRLELQYLHIPSDTTLLALGVFRETVKVDMRHNGGCSDSKGLGLRSDFAHRFSKHWGVVARAEYASGDAATQVPIPFRGTLSYNQDSNRLYSQLCLVGNYDRASLPWLPLNWSLTPSLGTLLERNEFEKTTNSFGQPVSGTVGEKDSYSSAWCGLKFSDQRFRPFHPAPFFEVGYEYELKNDLNAVVDEPGILRSSVGFSMNLTHGARLDCKYTRHDGTSSLRKHESFTVHLAWSH